ncbi:hypothetical protein G6F68_009640 [Rhizopus microsporus]|nr:hypothetical protein G6F68_009640 [Rhizopus microsporus]
MLRYLLPLGVFMAMAVFLAMGLSCDPRAVPSAMIDEPAPAISLPLLQAPGQQLDVQSLRGQVWLLNVWASWCGPCREELPVLREAAQRHGIPLYGLNYKDKPEDALAWLARNGNPYIASASDTDGRVGIEYGVYGVPETFVIDGAGRIRYKQLGLITPDIWRNRIQPLIEGGAGVRRASAACPARVVFRRPATRRQAGPRPALPGLPEPDAGGLQCAARSRHAQPDPCPTGRGPQRRADHALLRRPLRRFRPLRPAVQTHHLAAVAGAVRVAGAGLLGIDAYAETPVGRPRALDGRRTRPRRPLSGYRFMTTLWLAVLLLLLATLLCLIPPLVRRAPPVDTAYDANVRAFYLAQREQLRRDRQNGSLTADGLARAEYELQRDLLQDLAQRQRQAAPVRGQRAGVATACLLSVLIPVAAVLLYGKLGNPRAAADVSVMASAAEPHADDTGDDMALAINALAQRLRNAPDDADGWYTLARSYETLGRYTDAVAAYQQVLRLVPGQPAVLADLADALLSANQGVPDANAVAAVAQSLAALQWLQQQGAEQIYFKYCSTFDSTPQGNIGPVTDALMTQLGTAFTIATPAFPDNKRTVFKGYLFAGDVLLNESGMQHHPLTPMTDPNLVPW